MVKSIFTLMSILVLVPFVAQAKPGKNGNRNQPVAQDQELEQLEDILDSEASDLLYSASRGGKIDGDDIAAGIISIIGELASRNERGMGRGHRNPGFGRHNRLVRCVAKNMHNRRFVAEGYVPRRVERRALRTCQDLTRDRRAVRTCRVVRCAWSRW